MHIATVPNAICRKRFRDILSNFYSADNVEINADRYYKIRCLFDILNCNFKKHFSATDHSIDKTMIPYFGKYGAQQFVCGQPIRFGFKLWCLASPDGHLFHVEPYCGADTKLSDTGFGQGDVVLACRVIFLLPLTSFFPLLDELLKRVIRSLTTIRHNRLENAAVSTKQTMRKTEKTFL